MEISLKDRRELDKLPPIHVEIASQWIEVKYGEVMICFDLVDQGLGRTWTWRCNKGYLEAMHDAEAKSS